MNFLSLLFTVTFVIPVSIDAFEVEYCYTGGWVGSHESLDLSKLKKEKCIFEGKWCRTKYNKYGKLAYSECTSKIFCTDDNGKEMRNACKNTSFGEMECCCDRDLCLGSGRFVKYQPSNTFVLLVAKPSPYA
uniref:Uncharacterized protein n=1 Tax=Plectus sambesii TaxID=2011161 RepID=A0A914ULA7_9BILA